MLLRNSSAGVGYFDDRLFWVAVQGQDNPSPFIRKLVADLGCANRIIYYSFD